MLAIQIVLAAAIAGVATAVEIGYLIHGPISDPTNPFSFALSLLLFSYCGSMFMTEWRRGRLFSPLNLYAALVTLHFALPGLLLAVGWLSFRYELNDPWLTDALYFVLLCLVVFQIGTLIAARVRPAACRRSYNTTLWGGGRTLAAIGLLLTIGWAARLYLMSQGAYFQLDRANAEISTFGAVFVFLELFPLYGFILALVAHFHRVRLGAANSLAFMALGLAGLTEFLYWIGAGRKLESILVLVFAVIVRYLLTRRLPPAPVIFVCVMGIVLLFPAVFYYRYALEVGFGLGTDLASIPAIVKEATTVVDDAGPAAEIIVNRFNLNESVSAAIRLIETDEWPLRYGSSYVDIVLILVPRFLWPSKPDYHYGTDFGHASGQSGLSDELTSISVTYFGEAYLNLMWAGCLVFLLLGWLAEKLYSKACIANDPRWVLLYGLFLPPFLYVGGTVALYFGALIRLIILFYIVGTLLTLYRVRVRSAARTLHAGAATD